MKIAVVGAGIAGITAAYLIAKRHDVTLIERNDYVGGHTNTIEVPDNSGLVPVDTGFIVCNPKTYPQFYRLLDEWAVSLRDSDMSFGYFCSRTGFGYVGPGWRNFLRKPSNLLNRPLLAMIRERKQFNRRAATDLERGALDALTLGQYLDHIGVSRFFIEHYLIPQAAAVWSSPDEDMLQFPAATFIRFFANHGMLELHEPPTWQTVVGGSHAYVKAFRSKFRGTVLTESPVESVQRVQDGVLIRITGRKAQRFDRVVLAMHADESLDALVDATDQERSALSAWRYHRNLVQLHTDADVMPPDRRLWASWNYYRRANAGSQAPVPITYHMNRLQGLRTRHDYFVSLNATERVHPGKVLYQIEYTHPGFACSSFEAQKLLRDINGTRHTYFCGSYMRHGFHEDAVVSALEVATHLDCSL